ncbi:MAG: winged helix-turn-helix domain-containing protein [Vicinamibacterales bacterium]
METTGHPQGAYEFGPFRIDAAERLLRRGDDVLPLTPKAVDTLVALVENRGRLVSKDELMTRLWPGTFVEEANLTNQISLLRKAPCRASRICVMRRPETAKKISASANHWWTRQAAVPCQHLPPAISLHPRVGGEELQFAPFSGEALRRLVGGQHTLHDGHVRGAGDADLCHIVAREWPPGQLAPRGDAVGCEVLNRGTDSDDRELRGHHALQDRFVLRGKRVHPLPFEPRELFNVSTGGSDRLN